MRREEQLSFIRAMDALLGCVCTISSRMIAKPMSTGGIGLVAHVSEWIAERREHPADRAVTADELRRFQGMGSLSPL